MNAIDLLDALSDVSGKYILEAQGAREPKRKVRGRSRLRVLLIAAAMALLLAGCTYAALRMRDMKLGEFTWSPDGVSEERRDLISVQGFTGSPNYMATKEWMEFEKNYDPDQVLLRASNKSGFIPPVRYRSYACYTQEMVDKVDEICEKYHLSLKGNWSFTNSDWDGSPGSVQRFYDSLGIPGIHLDDAPIDASLAAGYYTEDGSFHIEGSVFLTDPALNWKYPVNYTLLYSRKQSFESSGNSIGHIEDYTEWDYVTKSGPRVLLAQSSDSAFILADQKDAFFTIWVQNFYWEEADLSARVLEALADTFDFNIRTDTLTVPSQTYADLISETYPFPSTHDRYLLWDLDGDGVEELFTGADGHIHTMMAMDGGTAQIVWADGLSQCWLRSDGSIVDYSEIDGTTTCRVLRWEGSKFRYLDYLIKEPFQYDLWGRSKSLGDYPKVDTLLSEEEAREILKDYLPPEGQSGFPLDREWLPLVDFPGAKFQGPPSDAPSFTANEDLLMTQRIITILNCDPRSFEDTYIYYNSQIYMFQGVESCTDYEDCTPLGRLIYNEDFPSVDLMTDYLDHGGWQAYHLTGGTVEDAIRVDRGGAANLLFVPIGKSYPSDFECTENRDGSLTILRYRGFQHFITIPDTIDGKPVTAIGDGAFADMYYPQIVEIPEGIRSIGNSAFSGCYGLVEVKLPASLEEIGDLAFNRCPQLRALYFAGDAPKIGSSILDEPRSDILNGYTNLYYRENTLGWDREEWSDYDLCLCQPPC